MKLLRCHIENFGTLSDFDFTFKDGLTVICRENGFGKSTFAAFIKAMLYGLPKTGSRSVVENERKRYDPWQGGKYGGFLEFEYQATAYRVTRYFGKTAAKDEFSVIDLSGRRSDTPFSKQLGEELFGLDADSFARSTYMPQLASREMEATTSIRTKLSDLVDNTNDMNNFDTATAALRRQRMKYRAYRGSGGEIGELERQYHELEEQRYQAGEKQPRLQEVYREIQELNDRREEKLAEQTALREKIRRSAEQKAVLFRRKRLEELQTAVDERRRALKKLEEKYPAGFPAAEELRARREDMSVSRQAQHQLETLHLSEEEQVRLQAEKPFFEDQQRADREVEQCQQLCDKLAQAEARTRVELLPAEQQRLQQLRSRFPGGVPAGEELRQAVQAADELYACQRQLDAVTVSGRTQMRYEQLRRLFHSGVPEEGTLSALEQCQRRTQQLHALREECSLPPEREQEYQALQRTFASGVPEEQEISRRQQDCRRITELTGVKNTKTDRVQQASAPFAGPAGAVIPVGVLGVLLLVGGAVCLAMQKPALGGGLLAAGVIGVLAAILLREKAAGGRRVSVITASAITDEENQELYDLQRGVNDFLLRYYPDAAQPESKLVQLLLDARRYTELRERRNELEARRQAVGAELEENERFLYETLSRYELSGADCGATVQQLRAACREYETLQQQLRQMESERSALSEKAEAHRETVLTLLHRYTPGTLPEDLRQGVRDLAADAAALQELESRERSLQENSAAERQLAEQLTTQLRAVLEAYHALLPQQSYSQCLRQLRARWEAYRLAAGRQADLERSRMQAQTRKQAADAAVRDFLERYQLSGEDPASLLDRAETDLPSCDLARKNLAEAEESLRAFRTENPELAMQAEAAQEQLPELETLQTEEQVVQQTLDETDSRLRGLRQERDSLRRVVENIPDWDDQMARLARQRREAEEKCALLDRTMALMEQARDRLASSYIGPVERGFREYAATLLTPRLGHVMVDKDLHLHIDAQGAAREVGCFSAGTADSIMLCMRLALVDALFTKEKPFLILDDPFVNLDDWHTARGLELLRQVAASRQIIYLVCNSSRSGEAAERTL